MTIPRFPFAPCVSLLTLGFLAGCGGGGSVEPPPMPTAVTAVSGNGQTGRAGNVLAAPVTVRVTSSAGGGMEGISVSFTAATTSGSVSSPTVATDADGVASITWTVGNEPGVNVDTVRASVSGLNTPAVFTATVTAAAPATLTSISGNAQSGVPGQPLAQPLVVVVRDRFGNGTPDVPVTWAVTAGGGTLSSPTSSTGADGHASIGWTPGGPGTNTVHAEVAGLTGSPVSFSASVIAPTTQLSIASGDNQTGAPGALLPQPLVASLRTEADTAVSGVSVSWAVAAGSGTVSQPSVPTDGQGRSSVTWTLGPESEAQRLTASVAGANGSPVTFHAVSQVPSGTVTVASITPSPMVEGQSATMTGSGFSVTTLGNAVTIGGVSAAVTSATATSLTVTVPAFDCQPARDVAVQVTVAAEASNVITQALSPASFTSVAVGQQLVLDDPAKFCLQLAASASAEDYLIGVQSSSEVVTSLTPAALTAVTVSSATSVEALPELTSSTAGVAPNLLNTRRATLLTGHRRAEQTLRAAEQRELGAARTMLGRQPDLRRTQAFSIPPDVEVGDLVTVRVADLRSTSLCGNYAEIVTVAKAVGTRGVWLADNTNPAGGYTDTDYQAMSSQLDNTIYPVDVDYFGTPSDFDENGRLVVVVTNEVNQFVNAAGSGTLGFVFTGDLLPRSECSSSNEGEVFYGIAPDPIGEHGLGPISREQAIALQPSLIAHEFTHTIQVGRRVLAGAPPPVRWLAEGQATLAEEIVGHAVEGRGAGNNYGFDVAFNLDNTLTDWYSDLFADLVFYFGFESPDSKVAGAPEQCSWLDRPPANSGPCNSGRAVYLSWSLLRWLTDQFGPTFAGGPQGLHRALINNPAVGYSNIASVVGVPIKTLLAQWAATLYTDDRVTGLDPKLRLSSWNLFNIFDDNLVETARLVPRSRGFASFTDNFSVRAGSSAYFRVSGSSRPATAVRIRNNSGGTLPAIMQVFVVRLQ